VPLIKSKSKQAFSKNVEKEMSEGKPQKQSLAIAYNMKRKAKKMAEGGQITGNYQGACDEHCTHPCQVHPQAEYDEADYNESRPMKSDSAAMHESGRRLNQHGEIEEGPEGDGGEHSESYEGNPGNSHDEYQDTMHEDMVGRIMKQRQQRFSEGGKVANQDEEITGDMPNEFDVLHLEDNLEGHDTGANSGDELGDAQEDKDRADIVARIMASRKKKDRNPNPA
jgi:hypothetical protein